MRAHHLTLITTAAAALAAAPAAAQQDAPATPPAAQAPAAEAAVDAAALYNDGCTYAREGDKELASKYLSRAAELGHPQAGLTYGVWCFTEHDYRPAILYLTPEALAGNAHALFCLGYMHYKGWGLPRQVEEARKLFTAAAQQGHPQARTMLALILLGGDASEQDAAQAAALLNAVLENDPAATPPAAEPADTPETPAPEAAETPEAADTPEDETPETDDADADSPEDETPETDDADTDSPEDEDTEDEDTEDEEDNSRIVEEMLELSNLHLPTPERLLGYLQLRGVGLPEHPENAFTLLINAANNGDNDDTTNYTIATLYRRGIGIDASEASASDWELRVAEEDRAHIASLLEAYLTAADAAAARKAVAALLLPPSQPEDPEHWAMVEALMQLPPYVLHEEDRTDYRERLETAAYWQENGCRYLHAGGDGTAGECIFILTESGELYIAQEDWEEGCYNILRYDPQTRHPLPLFSLRKETLN